MSSRTFSSRSISLGPRLLGFSAAAAALLTLQGCDNHTTSGVYPNAQACVAERIFTPEYCQQNFRIAQAEHTRLAPHYDSKKDCEEDWSDGQCDQVSSGARVVYSPHMGGYWVGYSESPSGNDNQTPTRRAFSYPIYQSRQGELYSPATDQSFNEFGRAYSAPDTVTARSVEASPRPVFSKGSSFSHGSVSRGGFGATARGFGFGVGE